MVNYVILENGSLKRHSGMDFHNKNIIWVDLMDATAEEKESVESSFGIELFTRQESVEIESSSKYVESEDEIGINLNFIRLHEDTYQTEPVSFIIRGDVLFTQRSHHYRSFDDIYGKLKVNKPEDGDDIFLSLLETRIDFDADLIETITEQITAIGREMVRENDTEREILLKITALQQSTIAIRENIVEKQRVLSAILKSKIFPKEDYETIRIMIKDVSSLLEHSSFNFERLEFLQNTFLGLVDMEQNRIIKIFTVVTVIFMPPTLIASLYGMNFQYMPELDEIWGYPFALILMIISSMVTLLFFKKKKWL